MKQEGATVRSPLFICPRSVHGSPMTALADIGAALAEIAGWFAFWAWLRLDKSIWWIVPGMASLALFAWLLTLVDAEHAGRTYAAYGGAYIVSALLWLWAVEGAKPDRWALIGARSDEHTSELQSLMRNSDAVSCLKKKTY